MSGATKVGRILKAAAVQRGVGPVPWKPPPEAHVLQGGGERVELIREGGQVVAVRVCCGCGRSHELRFEANESTEEGLEEKSS